MRLLSCPARLGLSGTIIAKLEYLSPGSSKKDRIARQMVEEAVASGALSPGQPVVELTSGNTGTGLAIACACVGHPFIAVMSRGNSPERARMMRALGAEVVLVDQAAGSRAGEVGGADLARVFDVAERVVAERGAYRADQFQLGGNVRAHELHTGPELLRQAAGSGLQIDAFVDFVGSGGTFAGVANALRAAAATTATASSGGGDGGGSSASSGVSAGVRCYVVEPNGAAVLSGDTDPSGPQAAHPIQGGGYSMSELSMLGADLLRAPPDGYLRVGGDDATETARQLAKWEGVFGGFSGGANVAAAAQLLRSERHRGGVVACVICDSGLKYLSTDLWGAEEGMTS